ncbi:MAG: chromosomal replication initiator protein DnaA [Solirubrobacteraceae bacterium]
MSIPATNPEVEQTWSHIRSALRSAVDESIYQIWLDPLEALDLTPDTLRLRVPAHISRWVQSRFGELLHDCAAQVLGHRVTLDLTTDTTEGSGVERPTDGPATPTAQRSFHPKLTFDQFVIGDSNRLAHAAALAVAEMPGHAYNPLFICGPPGVGKTHLLHSIGELVRTHNPGLSVRLSTGEAFTNEFQRALTGGRLDTFKAGFRHLDVLLLDDVQFFERKTKTEEEFFHTFNALHEVGSQVVLTSDRPPKDLQALEDRLRERFQAGLVADISPPELATRVAILRKRAQCDDIHLPDLGVLTFIAQHVQTNVRALEGALIRIVAYSSLTGRALTSELAHEVLSRLYPQATTSGQSSTTPSVQTIQAAVCSHFEISTQELLSSSRSARVTIPRQIAMYLARELTEQSFPSIGRSFGGRDHSTAMYAWRQAKKRLDCDESLRHTVENLCSKLSENNRDRRS